MYPWSKREVQFKIIMKQASLNFELKIQVNFYSFWQYSPEQREEYSGDFLLQPCCGLRVPRYAVHQHIHLQCLPFLRHQSPHSVRVSSACPDELASSAGQAVAGLHAHGLECDWGGTMQDYAWGQQQLLWEASEMGGKGVLPRLASQSEPSPHFEPFLHLHGDLSNDVERKPVETQHITSCNLHSHNSISLHFRSLPQFPKLTYSHELLSA